ncbi:MAG: hypothetical protein M1826_002878 [Phylliscum demangeonii]|nr:MAG: hypothetical protein M1826_002878 [Phylliscum demangeonii]
MDSGVLGVIRALIARIPLVLGIILGRYLSRSGASADWDLRTELTIRLLRSFIDTARPHAIGKVQQWTVADAGVKGRRWIAQATFPKPDDSDVRSQLSRAIEALKEDGTETWTVPELVPVEGEWTSYRAQVASNARLPAISEAGKYERLMGEVKGEAVIFLCDPATHRPTTARLAKLTHGVAFSVRYRLAPQHPFPAGLLDALVAYLALLYPPPGAWHAAIAPWRIVFAGDSAGAGLCLALLQLVLELGRQSAPQGPRLRWFGRQVALPLPAGVAVNSGWYDIVHSLPSVHANAPYDYLPVPPAPPPAAVPTAAAKFPADAIWPATPPRPDLYADESCLLHPLVSPVTARSWAGAPPLLFLTGQEQLEDENRLVAARAMTSSSSSSSSSVPVVHYLRYAAMPHCFCLVLSPAAHPAARHCYERWAQFVAACVERPAALTSLAVSFSFPRPGRSSTTTTTTTTFTRATHKDGDAAAPEANRGVNGASASAATTQQQQQRDLDLLQDPLLLEIRTVEDVRARMKAVVARRRG